MKGWFGPKFKWGIAPTTWQGWLVLAIYIGFVAFILNSPDEAGFSKRRAIGLSTAAFVILVMNTFKRR